MFFSLVQGMSSVFVGRLIDKYDSKRTVIAGSIIVGACFALLSMINSLWQLYLLYGISAIGFSSIGFVPATSTVFNWFEKNRGRIIGFVTVGIGVGGLVMPQVVGNGLIPNLGWRGAFLITGLLPPIILIPFFSAVVRRRPVELETPPNSTPKKSAENRAGTQKEIAERGLTAKQALRTSAFWLLAASGLLVGFSTMAITQNQVAHITDVGFSVALAAGAVSIVGAFSGIGKFFFGFICDFINPKYARVIGLVLQLGSIIILVNISSTSPVALVWLYAVLLGLSFGSWVPAMSMLTSTNFGMAAYGSILGMMTFFDMSGGATGPLFAGYIYDINQSYEIAFNTFIGLILVAIILTLFIRKPKQT
jgi:sugar phosphate permease